MLHICKRHEYFIFFYNFRKFDELYENLIINLSVDVENKLDVIKCLPVTSISQGMDSPIVLLT